MIKTDMNYIKETRIGRSMSIPEWHSLANNDDAPPVRILISGYSMFPLIRYQKDYVTIVPLKSSPARGDIVLISDPAGKRYVLHRVWQVKEGYALTWGDNCIQADGWIPFSDIWGKALQVERGGTIIPMDAKKGIYWATFWHKAGRPYRFAKRIRNGVIRRIRRIIPKR